MTRSFRHLCLSVALLGGLGLASLPAAAMPAGDLAPLAAAPATADAGQVIQARWYWHRHYRWHRYYRWHRHWRWHRRWW